MRLRLITKIFALQLILGSILFPAKFVLAQDEVSEDVKEPENKDDPQIIVDYSENEVGEEEYQSGFGRLFDSPDLASGLSNGSAIINRSIESLMEIVFYRLLDQSIKINFDDHLYFKAGVTRDVFPASGGAYIVIDKFSMGPSYAREISKIKGVPVNLGIDGRVNVFDIYLRTDGMRLAEQNELPWWQVTVNNFFGLLPILSAVLPPSFNPTEMYDPVNLAMSPFSFPLTIGGFRSMPIGAIRSYNVSGGVNLPFELAARLPKDITRQIARSDGAGVTLPYTIFVEGEHRINVLRRSKNIAWVGLTRIKRLGNRISAGAGKIISLMDKLILAKWWSGVPVKLFPLDAQWARAKANIFNQLYEFDLRSNAARSAYLEAVKGNFAPSWDLHIAGNQGVTFQFNRDENARESHEESGSNLLLLSTALESSRSESEVEVTDGEGKFFFLRSTSEQNEDFTEAITGRQREMYKFQVEMKVTRQKNSEDQSYTYTLDKTAEHPINLTASFRILDRYVDTHEYRSYLRKIRFFTGLPLKSAPVIALRDTDLQHERRARMALQNPTNDYLDIHVTPTFLGRFDSNAAVLFNSASLRNIFSKTLDEKWSAFANAFQLNVEDWNTSEKRSGMRAGVHWLGYMASRPLIAFNLRDVQVDFIAEAQRSISLLNKIAVENSPLAMLAYYDELFSTPHPARLTNALFELSEKTNVPRAVTINAKSKGSANRNVKKAFDLLRNRVFRSVLKFPPVERSRLTDEKLNAFYPDELRERRLKPGIRRVEVKLKPLSREQRQTLIGSHYAHEEGFSKIISQKYLSVTLFAKRMSSVKPGKIYVRIGQAGKLQLGKFVLAEKVIEISPQLASDPNASAEEGIKYEFFLNGPLSQLTGEFYESSIAEGGELQIDIGLSNDGKVWSDERSVRVQYQKGRLAPAE